MRTIKTGPEPHVMVPVTYEFLEPARLHIRYPNGYVKLLGFGIGEKIQVLEPCVQWGSDGIHTEIPLADGSHILDCPANIKTALVWGQSEHGWSNGRGSEPTINYKLKE
jgi:hypothetical protein